MLLNFTTVEDGTRSGRNCRSDTLSIPKSKCAIFFSLMLKTKRILSLFLATTRLNVVYLLLTAKFTKEKGWKNLLQLLLIGIRYETPFIKHIDAYMYSICIILCMYVKFSSHFFTNEEENCFFSLFHLISLCFSFSFVFHNNIFL